MDTSYKSDNDYNIYNLSSNRIDDMDTVINEDNHNSDTDDKNNEGFYTHRSNIIKESDTLRESISKMNPFEILRQKNKKMEAEIS